MKKRVALVRGPGLNSWEAQMYTPLADAFEIDAIVSQSPYFDTSKVPFTQRKLFSLGRLLRARVLRKPMSTLLGDYHDLQGLSRVLQDYDIVHCLDPMYYCTYQAAKAKPGAHFKLVLTVWENIPFLYHHPAAARNKRLIYERADLIIAVSERTREVLVLEGAPREKICILMPGIDIGHFRPTGKDPDLLKRFNCREDDLVILYVANIFREKGIFDLLYAFRCLLNQWKSDRRIMLLVAGKGRDKEQVASLINTLQLSNNALLIGSHGYSLMPAIHNLADVFVLPSLPTRTWQEQFGYVLAESLACGKPVVSTLSGSIPEVVGNAGILVQPNDFLSLSQALERLLVDEHLREECGKRARQRADECFDAQKVASRVRALYTGLLKHTP